jgi:hypothetical protein
MSRGTATGLTIIVVLFCAALYYGWKVKPEPSQATLLVAFVMCAVTAVYALLTFGILRENRAMAEASTNSTHLMERSLRFSFAPHLLYSTLGTKDVKLVKHPGFAPIENEDYRTALNQYVEGEQQVEFVFAVVQNVGRGSATNLDIEAQYSVWDSSSPNKNYTVSKAAAVQILEPGKAVALCIFVSKVPTTDDKVEIIKATLLTSDYYRDALREERQQTSIERGNHHTDSESGCAIRLT